VLEAEKEWETFVLEEIKPADGSGGRTIRECGQRKTGQLQAAPPKS
jgi:hypothetical protein